jgi:hypothetical protein
LCRNCLLQQVIEGKIKWWIEVTERQGRKRRKLLDDPNPLTPNDLKGRRSVSPLKIKTPVKTCVKNQQIHQLFIQFINYVQ